jgi:anti-sigma factor RsiW
MSNLRQPDDGVERELVAHALGELDAVERERLERRLADDPDLRSRFAEASLGCRGAAASAHSGPRHTNLSSGGYAP